MKKNLLFLAIALYIGGCTYKDDLAKVNFIRKRYRLSTYYYDPYDKYIIYNWRKRAISNITRYDSLGNVTDYCRTLSDDYIYYSKDYLSRKNTNPIDEDMNYYLRIDRDNNYLIDSNENGIDTIRAFYFVRGSKRIVTYPNKDGQFLLFEYQ